jgi:hypothetical protein
MDADFLAGVPALLQLLLAEGRAEQGQPGLFRGYVLPTTNTCVPPELSR